jgi:hypothetical protein
MTEIAVIVGAGTVLVGGFISWYAAWHRRFESSFRRVPVRTRGSVRVLREGSRLDQPR